MEYANLRKNEVLCDKCQRVVDLNDNTHAVDDDGELICIDCRAATTATKHTPGPWTVEAHDEDGNLYAVSNESNPPFGDMKKENAGANARLIASAPALLEACQGMMAVLENVDFSGLGENDYDEMPWGKWEDAIKSATG